MRRTIFSAVPLAALALAAPAAAHGGHATTYRAKLAPVATAPAAEAASHDEQADALESVRGNAQLVDGPRRDKVQLHVKGLTAGESYSWSVREAAPAAEAANDERPVVAPDAGEPELDEPAGACAGEEVAAFEYAPLVARRHGHSRARARSTTFTAEAGATYVVVVTAADGTDVACGEFESRLSHRQAKAERKAERRAAKRKAGKHDSGASGEHEDESGEDEGV